MKINKSGKLSDILLGLHVLARRLETDERIKLNLTKEKLTIIDKLQNYIKRVK